jgi:hypothetical protein
MLWNHVYHATSAHPTPAARFDILALYIKVTLVTRGHLQSVVNPRPFKPHVPLKFCIDFLGPFDVATRGNKYVFDRFVGGLS